MANNALSDSLHQKKQTTGRSIHPHKNSHSGSVKNLLLTGLVIMFAIPNLLFGQEISWTGEGDGTSWNQAANWSENRVPGSEDDVAITLNGTYTVTQPSGNITINSFTLGGDEGIQTLEKNSGTLILNDESLIGENGVLLMTAGYISGEGSLVNTGLIQSNSTSWSGLNNFTLYNDGVFEHINGIFYMASAATLENSGLYDIQGDNNIIQSGAASTFINNSRFLKSAAGDGSTSINVLFDSRPGSTIESAAGEIRLQGASTYHNTTFVADESSASVHLLTATHTFRGTITGAPTGLVILNSSALAHEEDAMFDFAGTGLTWTSNYMTGGGTFTNAGLIRLDAPSWTGVNGSVLINEGMIEHINGIFYMASAATLENNSLYDIQGDNNIIQSGAASTFINNSRFLKSATGDGLTTINVLFDSRPGSAIESAAGEIRLQGASTYHNTTFVADENSASIQLQSSTHTFRGTITGEPVGQIIINTNVKAHSEDGAIWNFGGNGLTWISNYLLSGGTLTNAGLVTMDAPSWTGLNNATMINEGEMIQTSGIFYISSSGVLENNGLYQIDGGSGILAFGAAGSFLNNDQLVLAGDISPFTVSAIIENSASSTVDIQNGDLRFSGNGTHLSPEFIVSENASLSFFSGLHSFSGLINTQPQGDFILRTNFRTEPSQATFNIGGDGLTWESGFLTEGTITSSGIMTIAVSGSPGVSGGTFVNSGNTTFTGGSFRIFADSEFRNTSTFTVSDDFTIVSTTQNPGIFSNSGLFQKTGGEGSSSFQSDFMNESTGELRHETGEIRFLAELNLSENSMLAGTGRLDITRADLINKGVTAPGSPLGVFTIAGDYIPNDTTAVLDIALYEIEETESGTMIPTSDRLEVVRSSYNIGFSRPGGNSELAGSLNVETDGTFIPDVGSEFEIIRSERGISGGFSSYNGVVDQVNQLSYYPQLRDTSLFLVTYEGVPSLTGDIEANPSDVQAGGQQMITFSGSGFPPDVSVELNCLECSEPNLFSSFAGRIGSVSPDTAEVWFDLTDGRISGSYEAVFTDPRGGSAQTEIFIEQAPLAFSVNILKESTQGDDNTGLFVIRSNRTPNENIDLTYTSYGSAQQYVHYTTDLLGGTIQFPAGADSIVVSILPLSFEGSSRSVGLQIESVNQEISVAKLFASMTINPSTGETPLRVLNYTPDRGGNVGVVTITVTGVGFTEASSITLSSGLSAQNISVNETGTKMTGFLDLIGQTAGLQDMTVSNGSEEVTRNSAFRVETGIYPEVYVQVFAPVRVPRIRDRTYTIILQNQGNVDVRGYAAIGGLPADAEWSIDDSEFGINDDAGFEWKDVAPVTQKGETIQISFPYINLAAGETRKINITTSVPTAQTMQLVAAWFYN